MLGVLAGLGGNGAVDPDTTILQIHLGQVGLLHSQFALCKALGKEKEKTVNDLGANGKMSAVTGTQCGFCFVTDDLCWGLFRVAAGQEHIMVRWLEEAGDKETEGRRGKCQANQSWKEWEVGW